MINIFHSLKTYPKFRKNYGEIMTSLTDYIPRNSYHELRVFILKNALFFSFSYDLNLEKIESEEEEETGKMPLTTN